MSPRYVTVFWCSGLYLPSQHKGGRGKRTVTNLCPSLITWEVAGQYRLQCETVSQKKNKQEEWMTWFYRLNNKTKIETRSRLTVAFSFQPPYSWPQSLEANILLEQRTGSSRSILEQSLQLTPFLENQLSLSTLESPLSWLHFCQHGSPAVTLWGWCWSNFLQSIQGFREYPLC